MLYDYEKSGHVSLWLGCFNDDAQLNDYLSTVYQDEDTPGFEDKLCSIFLSHNKSRACEQELRQLFFEAGLYNQFKYDFGLAFDEDFMERNFLGEPSADLTVLLQDHSYAATFLSGFVTQCGEVLSEPYNSVILIYDCQYGGNTKRIENERFTIDFIGTAAYRPED